MKSEMMINSLWNEPEEVKMIVGAISLLFNMLGIPNTEQTAYALRYLAELGDAKRAEDASKKDGEVSELERMMMAKPAVEV